MSVAYGGARDALKPRIHGDHFGIFPTKGESWNSLCVYFWKNSQDQLSFVPLSASGTEKSEGSATTRFRVRDFEITRFRTQISRFRLRFIDFRISASDG